MNCDFLFTANGKSHFYDIFVGVVVSVIKNIQVEEET